MAHIGFFCFSKQCGFNFSILARDETSDSATLQGKMKVQFVSVAVLVRK